MANSLVFITGATGFIGAQVVATTLQAGYRVRLSIRNPEQEQAIKRRYPDFVSKIETVVIPNITKQDYFRNALNDVDYIFHLASPMPGKGSDVKKDYVEPAVQGTEALLHAALGFPQIKKVIVVSSVLALVPVDARFQKAIFAKDNTGEVFPVNLDMPFPDGRPGHGLKYSASKILAHQATRDFLKTSNPHYTLLTLHPVYVLGESLIQNSAEEIGGMNAVFWQSLFSDKPMFETAWVHVRDVADAHIKALESPAETGTEFILSNPMFTWEEAVDYINKEYPTLGCKLEPPFESKLKVDASTAEKVLGMKWISKEKIISDIVQQQVALKEKAKT